MKKQIFIFTERQIHHSRMYGNSIIECKIYVMKNNLPEYVGKVEYNTASNPGNTTVVFRWLVENKKLPKRFDKRKLSENGFYLVNNDYTREVENQGCIIQCMYNWR